MAALGLALILQAPPQMVGNRYDHDLPHPQKVIGTMRRRDSHFWLSDNSAKTKTCAFIVALC